MERVNSFTGRMPGDRSRPCSYRAPEAGAELRGFRAAVDAALEGSVERADALLDEYGYDASVLSDEGSDVVLIEERQLADGSTPRGWGLYVIRPDAGSDVVVQVPHPSADVNTEDLGVEVFRESRAAALLVAGTHRENCMDPDVGNDDCADSDYASCPADVAHREPSAFQAVHEALVDEGLTVLQLHGFRVGEGDEHRAQYAEVIVSSGSTEPTRTARALSRSLSSEGLDACLFPEPVRCPGLGGTQNLQAHTSPDHRFVHVEVRDDLRKGGRDNPMWDRLVRGLATLEPDGSRP